MKNIWNKQTSLGSPTGCTQETWLRTTDSGIESYDIDLYLGKKTDLLSLKKNLVDTIKAQLEYFKTTREELYTDTEPVVNCPVTGIDTSLTTPLINIYGAEYVVTPDTGHVYVKNRPRKSAIDNFYLNNVTYAATYTDKAKAEERLNTIAVPWCNWVTKVYEKQYGKKPKRILDIGSGAGHFIEACRRAGYEADGIELSESSREFAREIWGFDMDGRDFTKIASEYEGYDIVTFWGLLEHTPNPGSILKAAHDVVSKGDAGMVISKVPRAHSLSGAAQITNNTTIIRHMDPMGHIMLFSDASAAELYVKENFKPTAAWYYGMDVYETFMQIGNSTGNYSALTNTSNFQMELQQHIDNVRFSDGLTLVGIPQNPKT